MGVVACVVGIWSCERPCGAALGQDMMRHRFERLAGGLFGFRIGHGEAPVDGRSKAIMLIPISARRRAIARARDQLGSIRVACDIIRTKAGKSDAIATMAPALRRL